MQKSAKTRIKLSKLNQYFIMFLIKRIFLKPVNCRHVGIMQFLQEPVVTGIRS